VKLIPLGLIYMVHLHVLGFGISVVTKDLA